MSSGRPQFDQDAPTLVVTADVDWASEDCIRVFVESMQGFGVRPTLFVTHQSEVIAEYLDRGLIEVGIHPNFFRGSDHGETEADVIRRVLEFAPGAVASRSHGYFEHSRIAPLLKQQGIFHDSNLCLFGQAGIGPIDHWSGLTKWPVFWEDDIHWTLGMSWNVADHVALFATPGLKIIDLHPFNYAFNIDGDESYNRLKSATTTATKLEIEDLRVLKDGSRTFIDGVLSSLVRDKVKLSCLSDLIGASSKCT